MSPNARCTALQFSSNSSSEFSSSGLSLERAALSFFFSFCVRHSNPIQKRVDKNNSKNDHEWKCATKVFIRVSRLSSYNKRRFTYIIMWEGDTPWALGIFLRNIMVTSAHKSCLRPDFSSWCLNIASPTFRSYPLIAFCVSYLFCFVERMKSNAYVYICSSVFETEMKNANKNTHR